MQQNRPIPYQTVWRWCGQSLASIKTCCSTDWEVHEEATDHAVPIEANQKYGPLCLQWSSGGWDPLYDKIWLIVCGREAFKVAVVHTFHLSVPQIRPLPPFATLALVQNAGGAYTRDVTISLAITPSLPSMKPFSEGVGAKRGASLSLRQRDAPETRGRLTSFSIEERGSRTLRRSSWCVHRWSGRSLCSR